MKFFCTKITPPPRYRVKFENGERELDALEILNLYRQNEVNFSTQLCRIGEDNFHRLDIDSEFLPLLPRLYSQQKFYRSPWSVLWIALIPFVIMSSMLFFLPFALIRLLLVLFGIYILPMLFVLVEYSSFQPIAILKKRFPGIAGVIVPYWNGIIGYRIFHKLSEVLPERRRRSARILNVFFWFILELTFLGGVFLPGGRTGGLILYIMLCLTFLAGFLLLLPFRIGNRAMFRRWKLENPKPKSKILRLAPPLSIPDWAKPDYRISIEALLGGLGIILLAIAVYLLPYYIVGTLRYRAEIAQTSYQLVDTAELSLPQIPEPPDAACDFPGFQPTDKPMPETLKAEISTMLPQLDQFRNRLSILNFTTTNRLNLRKDDTIKSIHNYLHWRQLEYKMTEVAKRSTQVKQLFHDFDGLDRLQYHGTLDAIAATPYWNTRRLRLLESELAALSENELIRERDFWYDNETIRIDERMAKQAFGAYMQFFQYLDQPRLWLYPFIHGLKANFLAFNRKTLSLIKSDYYTSRASLTELKQERPEMIWLTPNWPWQGQYASREHAVSRLALAAIELEFYRREHGAYPEQPSLPRDPFSNDSLRYIPGKMLYSVNEDGLDDGGRRFTRHENDSTDIVFHLK